MKKLRNIRFILLLGVILSGVKGLAQMDRLNRVFDLYQSKKYEEARTAVDSVVKHPETAKDPLSWGTRAYVYYEFYKRQERTKLNSPLRDTLLNSLRISNSLNPDADQKQNNNRLMYTVSASLYNIALHLLQVSLDHEGSMAAYKRSQELARIIKPDSNFTYADAEYHVTTGSIFSEIYNKDNNNIKAQDIAKSSLLKALELQPDNTKANYNLGIMYYNQAVNLVKSLDFGADISQIDVIQESIIKLAKQAEQLIDKVYRKDTKNVKAVEALYFIHRMLNDNVKTEEFKKKCNELGIKLD